MITRAPERGCDKWGCGHYGAPRGDRTHNGIDLACCAGSEVLAISSGIVTKHGIVYSDPEKSHYRYVQVSSDGLDYRYFYVEPSVAVGRKVRQGEKIGVVQDLNLIYPGITNHVHFEIKQEDEYLDPTNFI